MTQSSSPATDQGGPPPALWKTFLATIVVLAFGLLLLAQSTSAGSGFTTETLRRAQVEKASLPIPHLNVVGGNGAPTALPVLLAAEPKVWIVDFVYLRCQTVCAALGTVFQQLQAQIQERGLEHEVGLLSISFDPANDSPQALREYAARMRMDTTIWKVVTLVSPSDRRELLDAFGIMVIPAPLGEFEHNAALHIVTNTGLLTRIVDYELATVALDIAHAYSP